MTAAATAAPAVTALTDPAAEAAIGAACRALHLPTVHSEANPRPPLRPTPGQA